MELSEGSLLTRSSYYPNRRMGDKTIIISKEGDGFNAISENGCKYKNVPKYIYDECFLHKKNIFIGDTKTENCIKDMFIAGDFNQYFYEDSRMSNGKMKISVEELKDIRVGEEKNQKYNSRNHDIPTLRILEYLYPPSNNSLFNEFREALSDDLIRRSGDLTQQGEIRKPINLLVDNRRFRSARLVRKYHSWNEIDEEVRDLIQMIFILKDTDGDSFWDNKVISKINP